MDPSYFLTRTIGELQGLLEVSITLLSNISSISFSTSPILAKGYLLGSCLMGGSFSVLILCSTRLVRPMSVEVVEKPF